MNGGRPNLFELLARLPPRIWLQGAVALIGFAILAVFGFAIIAGFLAIAVVILLVYRLRLWLSALFTGRPMPQPPARTDTPPSRPNVTDVTYEIVDRRDDKQP